MSSATATALGAMEVDGEGYLIFATDKMSNPELVEYLYNEVYEWFFERFHLSLTDEQKTTIRNRYYPDTAKRAILRDLKKYEREAVKTNAATVGL